MALPLGKLTILVGAGLIGSALAPEVGLSDVSDFFKGVFKVFKRITKDDSRPSVSKPHNDNLLAQVKHLQQELQTLASSRPITIVTASGTAAGKYGLIIVVVVAGYGYVWWKGWKLPDLMFATKRSLSDACNSVAKQLEDVYSSISAAQRQLSSKITSVDRDVNKIVEISQATKEEVSILRGRSKLIGEEFQSVRDVVQTLEIKLSEIESKQDFTAQGVQRLCVFAQNTELLQASPYSSSRTALEQPAITSSSRTGSLPLELPSPTSSNGSQKVDWPLQSALSASGLKDFNGVAEAGESSSSPKVSNGIRASEDLSNRSSSNVVLGRRFTASILTRQRSATSAVAQQALTNGLQC